MSEILRSSRNIPPCKGCPDRYLACSDHCQKPGYLAYKAERDKIREARKKESAAWAYTANEIKKNRRGR